jgi:Flp pilus assembly protein TadG
MRFWRDEHGTAVVEFAIVALPLCLIIFGILDFGRALNYFNDVTQLAGQGARAAAVNQNIDGLPADSTFQAKLAAEGDSPELTNKVQVCIQTVPTSVGQPVTVSVKYRFHFNAIVASIPITLRSTQSMRSEVATPTYNATCSPATLP